MPLQGDGGRDAHQFPSSPLPSYNNNTIYKIKSQNYNNNRKQQVQKATTISTSQQSPSTRKNGGGKQKNKNGKNNQRLSSTTAASSSLTTTTTMITSLPSSYTTVMLNQFNIGAQIVKSKGGNGKFNQTKSSSSVTSTTIARPKPTVKLPNMKNNGANNNLHSSSKLDQKYSNIYEKSSGKAPKQIKEGASPSLSTVNPSILRMFERYEKIQEIFPELEPQKESHNPVYFTVTNGKPSRENSKSFSNFVSFDSTTPQKKNTPNDRLETRQRYSSGSSSSNGKGTICFNTSSLIDSFYQSNCFFLFFLSFLCFLSFN